MAQALKRFYDEGLVRSIARDLAHAAPEFSVDAFVATCMDGLSGCELIERAWRIAEAMRLHLPQPFSAAADVIVASLGPELEGTDGFGMAPFRYLPHVLFIQKYGLDDFESSMRAQYELTKRSSAEWSIRAFLVRYPECAYDRLVVWSSDRNPHVRRLVSEGTRPRLPWAPRLRAFQLDPDPVIQLLERLRDDPEKYVQRSVANNLNDIAKDHPERVLDLCQDWLRDAHPARRWIVKHALRTLIKRGNCKALELMGGGDPPLIKIEKCRLSRRRVALPGAVGFSVVLQSTALEGQTLIVDYAVHFVKSNGATKPKVFKLRKLRLGAGDCVALEAKVSMQDMTTRRHYPGRHRIDLIVNGVTFELAEFVATR